MTLLPDDLVELQEVSDLTTGTYLVTTYSGTQHTIDLDNKTWVRQGCAGHEWKAGGKHPDITPDGEVFCFTTLNGTTGIKVGDRKSVV